MKPWIQTASGLAAWPLALTPDMVCLDDIAHALAQIPRFSGHGNRFYSVAEHSVHVSHRVPAKHAMIGLMHDAAEAYLGDIATPLKQFAGFASLVGFRSFNDVEHSVHLSICEALRLSPFGSFEVKDADTRMLATERRQLLGPEPMPWAVDAAPYPDLTLPCWSPTEAKQQFLARYAELRGAA